MTRTGAGLIGGRAIKAVATQLLGAAPSALGSSLPTLGLAWLAGTITDPGLHGAGLPWLLGLGLVVAGAVARLGATLPLGRGPHDAAASERVLTTVLFTDIVGATERVAELGDRRWQALLEQHHRVVRRELRRFGGREIDTAGDGFLVAFDSPARAIRCAGAISAALTPLGIRIRAGVHTGECERLDGQLRGIALHIGARVVATAAPGEVLVSSTVKDLVVGSGIRFDDRDARVLRGIPGEWRLFAVRPGSLAA